MGTGIVLVNDFHPYGASGPNYFDAHLNLLSCSSLRYHWFSRIPHRPDGTVDVSLFTVHTNWHCGFMGG